MQGKLKPKMKHKQKQKRARNGPVEMECFMVLDDREKVTENSQAG